MFCFQFSYDIAWYEQKAVAVLLALLFLGVKGIRLGPTLPAFPSPNGSQGVGGKVRYQTHWHRSRRYRCHDGRKVDLTLLNYLDSYLES